MIKTTKKRKVTIEDQKIIEYKPSKNPKSEINFDIKIDSPKQNNKKKRGKIPDFLHLP